VDEGGGGEPDGGAELTEREAAQLGVAGPELREGRRRLGERVEVCRVEREDGDALAREEARHRGGERGRGREDDVGGA
jgi:hypothetical protein